jgi:hypothetical protein
MVRKCLPLLRLVPLFLNADDLETMRILIQASAPTDDGSLHEAATVGNHSAAKLWLGLDFVGEQ